MGKRALATRALMGLTVMAVLGVAAAACGDDDSTTTPTAGTAATTSTASSSTATSAATTDSPEAAAVRKDINAELAAEKAGDADAFLAHVTDNWLKLVIGASRDDVKQNPSIFRSEDDNGLTPGAITVNGNNATVAVAVNDPASRLGYALKLGVLKQDGTWKLDTLHVVSPATVPSSSKVVNVDLVDYGFNFDKTQITSDKNLVFHVENKGQHHHMMDLAKIPADADVEALLSQDSENGPPAGVEDVGGVFLFAPGDKADIVLDGKLEPGRYVFVCFVADPDDPTHTPHAMKGMVSDFTVN
jgi:hypothetical protein